MSRIGKQPVEVPSGVTVSVDGQHVAVKGPKGSLERTFHSTVTIAQEGTTVTVTPNDQGREARGQWGLTRTLISNMVQGVQKPFERSLEISGVGYRAELKGKVLNLQVGLSHDVNHPLPDGVDCKIDKQTTVHLTSTDKELVGRVAAAIRAYRPCEPYKGKGIKYVGERIRRKEGKTGTK